MKANNRELNQEILTNDETLGEAYVGTKEEFRVALLESAILWHEELEYDCVFETWFEEILDEHLRPATKEDLENLPSIAGDL